MAAEGLKVLISLWIFACFSSLSFRESSSSSVALSLRRERTSLAPLAQAVLSPFPSSSPAQPPKGLQALRRAAAPIDLGGSEGGREGALPYALSGNKKPTRCGWV